MLLGLLTQWGLFRYWWLTIKLALTTILIGIILFVLVPGLGARADAAHAARAFTAAERLPLAFAPAVGVALLILMVVLAVFKPSWSSGSARHGRYEHG